MVEAYSIREDLLSPSVAGWLIWLMLLAGVVAWTAVHYFAGRIRGKWASGAFFFIAGGASGAFAAWSLFQVLGRFLLPGCAWPLWVLAAGASFSTETVLAAYRHERKIIGGWRGTRLVGLRLALLSDYYSRPDTAPQHILVVNYAGIDMERLPEGLRRLAQIWEEPSCMTN